MIAHGSRQLFRYVPHIFCPTFCGVNVPSSNAARHANCDHQTFHSFRHFITSVRVLLPADGKARPDLGLWSGCAPTFEVVQ